MSAGFANLLSKRNLVLIMLPGAALVVLIVLAVTMVAPPGEGADRVPMAASWARDYESIAELLEAPHAIAIVGRVAATGDTYPVGRGVPFTDSMVTVSDVLFGEPRFIDGSQVLVRQTGGVVGGRIHEIEGARLLQEGEEVLLFLRFDESFGKYSITGGPHGHYEIDDGVVRHANLVGDFTLSVRHPDVHPLAAFVTGESVEDVKDAVQEIGRAVDLHRS